MYQGNPLSLCELAKLSRQYLQLKEKYCKEIDIKNIPREEVILNKLGYFCFIAALVLFVPSVSVIIFVREFHVAPNVAVLSIVLCFIGFALLRLEERIHCPGIDWRNVERMRHAGILREWLGCESDVYALLPVFRKNAKQVKDRRIKWASAVKNVLTVVAAALGIDAVFDGSSLFTWIVIFVCFYVFLELMVLRAPYQTSRIEDCVFDLEIMMEQELAIGAGARVIKPQ